MKPPSTTWTEIGFMVAFGILLDAILVRSVLVTSRPPPTPVAIPA